MRLSLLIPALACTALAGCSGPWYAPPPQRHFQAVEEPDTPVAFLDMGLPEAGAFIVADVGLNIEGTGWRWTREHPRFRFRLPDARGWKFSMDFGLPAPNFKDTGPVTVTFVVNQRVLAEERYNEPGDRHFEKAVPAAWLRPGEDTIAGADISPPWIAPSDKARLGFVLHRAGFIR